MTIKQEDSLDLQEMKECWNDGNYVGMMGTMMKRARVVLKTLSGKSFIHRKFLMHF